jgi:hypothetical protein
VFGFVGVVFVVFVVGFVVCVFTGGFRRSFGVFGGFPGFC